jgi:2-amino-4-hydroxy-6-hydroxymethyldihydropteridine diphosphokinase
MMCEVYLGLGSNLGDRVANLNAGAVMLEKRVGAIEVSSLFTTAPIGFAMQPEFLNAACRLRTRLDPFDLMHTIRCIEDSVGRRRTFVNAPRTLDIDILLFGSQVLRGPPVSLPHPRLVERSFALAPLVELAPRLRHPVLGSTMSELLGRLPRANIRAALPSGRWDPRVTL